MPAVEFISLLESWDVTWLVALQILVFLLLYRAVGSRQSSLVDPFTIPLYFSASAWSTVVFLYMHDLCSARLFFTFVLTGIAFVAGYRQIAPVVPREARPVEPLRQQAPRDQRAFNQMGITVTSVLLATMVVNIALFGLGIQYENRLEIYTESAGLGVLKRISDALLPVTVFFLAYRLTQPSRLGRVLAFLVFVVIGAYTVLDGSKSGLIAIFLIVAAALRWLHSNIDSRVYVVSNRAAGITLALALALAALVVTFQLDAFDDYEKFLSGVGVLFYRVVLAADIYVLGFPGDSIDRITQASMPVVILFSDLLSTMRLASLDVVPIGTELYNYVTPVFELNAGGPNAHLGIYSYYLFGEVLGVIFCWLLGLAIGWVRKLYSYRSTSLVHGACATALMVNTAYVLVDPGYMMHRLTNMLIFLLPLYFLYRSRPAATR